MSIALYSGEMDIDSKAPGNAASVAQGDTEVCIGFRIHHLIFFFTHLMMCVIFVCFNLKCKDADSISNTMEQLNIGESSSSFKKKPVIIIVVGMAGIGCFMMKN